MTTKIDDRTKDLRDAYRAGRRSRKNLVDPDKALERWARRRCTHDPDTMCANEKAWMDGYEQDWRGILPDYMTTDPHDTTN